MSLRVWNDKVVPRLTDLSLRNPQIGEMRAAACEGLHGRILEIGFGSGLNAAHYPAAVTSVSAVEPADTGWALSAPRRAASAVPVERSGLDGQQLAEPDDSFDAALVTFSLCTIPDADLALREVRRVLRPGGRLHFLEHGLSPDPRVQAWQRRLEPIQRRVAGGCHLTRDVPALVRGAGFDIAWLQQDYAPGPRAAHPWTYASMGVATS
jgi:SAM-dependent methyltransferase